MDFSEQSHNKGEVYIYQIVLPLSDSMSVSTFSKFLWASGKPTCSCHIFYTNRRFPVCGYRHLAEQIWGCRGWQYYYLRRTVNFWGCRRKRRNCQSHVTVDRTNPRYIYIERFYNICWHSYPPMKTHLYINPKETGNRPSQLSRNTDVSIGCPVIIDSIVGGKIDALIQ